MSLYKITSSRALVILLFIFLHFPLFSQILSFKNYTENDGLLSSTVYAAMQDRQGFIWLSTSMGVSRFDGYSFINYTTSEGLSDNEIFNSYEDSQGRIWFSTQNGKVSYYKDGTIYNDKNDPSLLPANSQSLISSIVEDTTRHIIWISTYQDGVLAYFPDGHVERFFKDNNPFVYIRTIFPRQTGLILVGYNGIYEIELSNTIDRVTDVRCMLSIEYNHDDTIGGPFKSVQLKNGEVIFCTYSKAKSLLPGTNKLTSIWSDDSVDVNNVCISDGTIWICTRKGLLSYSIQSKKLLSTELEEHSIASVLVDAEGNRWITTLGAGVLFYPSDPIYQYTTKNGLLTDKITCLTKEAENKIWIGYEKGGISLIQNGTVKSQILSSKSIYENMLVNRIRFSYGKLWVITSYGPLLLSDNKSVLFPNQTRDMIEYPEGELIMAASLGIIHCNKECFDKYKKEKHWMNTRYELIIFDLSKYRSINEKARRLFMDSQSTIWMSTEKNLYIKRNDSVQNITRDCLQENTFVNDFSETVDGTMLLATNQEGIIAVRNKKKIAAITKDMGLGLDNCNALEIDTNGTIWAATNVGLNRIDGFPDDIRISLFNVNDGLLSNEIRDVLVANDTVWVGTRNGLNFFNKNIQRSDQPPFMLFQGISANGEQIKLDTSSVVRLPHYKNYVRIYFTGISYKNRGEIQYRYKLQDQTEWNYTTNTMVEFPNLTPGDYQFIASAAGRSGKWSKEIALQFSIIPPFWQTQAFIIGMILLFIGSSWLILSNYLKYRKKQFEQRYQVVASELKALRSQINPHFLFNAMNSIHSILLKKDWKTASEYLYKFSDLMRSILDHTDQNMITVAEEIETLNNYMTLEALRTDHKFDYTIDVDQNINPHDSEVPAMIVQPFVENAILHGLRHKKEKGRVSISFVEKDNTIMITIWDDGIGRKRAMELNSNRKRPSKGMKLTTDRIDMLNIRRKNKIAMKIEDLEDEEGNHPGTKVTIKIPFE